VLEVKITSFLISSDVTSGAATQSSLKVCSPSGSQDIQGMHDYDYISSNNSSQYQSSLSSIYTVRWALQKQELSTEDFSWITTLHV